jgi:arylsulfatase A-like enzyme
VGLEWALTISPADRELGLPATGASLPALLKTNGYRTALVGKWHLGWEPEFGPIAHGFDEFYGFLSGAQPAFEERGIPAEDRKDVDPIRTVARRERARRWPPAAGIDPIANKAR